MRRLELRPIEFGVIEPVVGGRDARVVAPILTRGEHRAEGIAGAEVVAEPRRRRRAASARFSQE